MCFQKFQQLPVRITIYNDCYVSTYGIPYIFKKTHFWFSKWHCTLLKGSWFSPFHFFADQISLKGRQYLLKDLQQLMEIHRNFWSKPSGPNNAEAVRVPLELYFYDPSATWKNHACFFLQQKRCEIAKSKDPKASTGGIRWSRAEEAISGLAWHLLGCEFSAGFIV